MIAIKLTVEDLARTRFAISPMAVTTISYRTLLFPELYPRHRGWASDLASYSAVQQQSILRLFDTVSQVQEIILASPTYHNTISGALKNLLDFLDIGEVGVEVPGRRFVSKAVSLITVQGGTSGTGNNTLMTMLLASRSMGGWVVPTVVSVPGWRGAFDAQGTAQDPTIRQRLHGLGAEVTAASAMLAQHWTVQA